jgi:hypothetical protein
VNALNDAAANASDSASDSAPPAGEDQSDHPGFDEIRQLTLEVLRLAHAGDALQAHLPANLRPGPIRRPNTTRRRLDTTRVLAHLITP